MTEIYNSGRRWSQRRDRELARRYRGVRGNRAEKDFCTNSRIAVLIWAHYWDARGWRVDVTDNREESPNA